MSKFMTKEEVMKKMFEESEFWCKMSKRNEMRNDIMKHLEEHYNRCYKVGCMMFDAKCGEPRSINMECCETMRQDNVITGIEWCCIAREAGIDVVVDMIWGYVIFKDEATDEIMENGKKRYMTFEYADDDIDEE